MQPQTQYNVFQPRSDLDFANLYAKLRSEFGPDAQSKARMTTELADVEIEIESCEAELHWLQSHISFLHTHRRHLGEYKICLHSLMSPIRKLPNELTVRIFDYACNMNDLTSRRLKTMPALAITCVCSHWRNLAKSSPQLWSRIRLNLTMMHTNRLGFDLLDMYLALSQQSPLIFEILGETLETLEPRQAALCIIVGACSERWKEFTVSQPTFYKALTALNPTSFPVLEKLSISSFAFRLPGSLDRFQDAPTLHSLSILTFPLAKVFKSQFPWNQLRVLNISSFSEEIRYLLELPSNLTDLYFCEWADGGYNKQASFPILAPSVQTLSLSVASQTQTDSQNLVDVIFASMSCPALTSLSIDRADVGDGYDRPWPKEIIQDFLFRSSCNLTTLSIKSVPLSDVATICILARLPSLHHLTIDDTGVNSDRSPVTSRLVQNLHAFRYDGKSFPSSILVPKLQTLSLVSSASNGFSDAELVKTVSSRRYTGGHTYDAVIGRPFLRSVLLRFPNRAVSEEVYSPMKHLEKAGLRVVVIAQNHILTFEG
ncbi:hypothetical protein J3R30DRAFT_3890980 [Lentinula aciculospora]|uniref:F-box domain-containing protein n=1 Tax=Lentinula aciculospora TaxID=153920 RepID=A0A9W9AAQ5_9AGAR|nr:hypothetical protein J3R30DRAFT_3890980 [Lentinula aciculospora]